MRAARAALSVLFIVCLTPFQLSCAGADDAPEKRAARAGARFHSLFEKQEFKEMYKMASARMQSEMGEEEFVSLFRNYRLRLGDVREARPLGEAGSAATLDGVRFTTSYHVKGSKAPCAYDTFWEFEDGDAKLVSFSFIFDFPQSQRK